MRQSTGSEQVPRRAVEAVRRFWPLLLPLLVAGSLGWRAVRDVDPEFDTWGYHLPYAARMVGIAGPSIYGFEDLKEARFRGFPLLGELAQGLLWRTTGRVQSANLVAFGSLVAFWIFLRRRFDVPYWLGIPAPLAVPLIQIHATSCYVDLPAGVAIAVAALSLFRIWLRDQEVEETDLALAGIGVAAAVNLKHLLLPIGGTIWLAAVLLVVTKGGRARRRLLAAWLVAAPLVFATPLRNVIVYGNPVYPVELRIGPYELPAAEGREVSDLTPPWWRQFSRPLRFALSALEVGAYDPNRPLPWVLDMGSVKRGSKSDRIGGTFFPNVLLHGGVLLWAAIAGGRAGRGAAALAGAVVAFAALQPQAQQMRFSLYWILVLVGLSCYLVFRREGEAARPSRRRSAALAAACWVALAIVVAGTRGYFLFAQGNTLANHLSSRLDRSLLERVSTPQGACLLGAQPNTFLYAAPFHAPKRYRLKAAFDPSECGDLPIVSARP